MSRLEAFHGLLIPFSTVARQRRMDAFAKTFSLRPGLRIIDLGGTPQIWGAIKVPLDLTILNLPGSPQHPVDSPHRITFVEGDACSVDDFPDNRFDIAFSNSVIEHVGGQANEARFAREVRRLAPRYWVQTPAIWFPIEAHSGVPFWFFLSTATRDRIMARWQKKLPAWTEMIRGTTIVARSRMREYFPEAKFYTERAFGIPKSNVAYKT